MTDQPALSGDASQKRQDPPNPTPPKSPENSPTERLESASEQSVSPDSAARAIQSAGRRELLLAVGLGIVAGLASGWLIETYRETYQPDVSFPDIAPEALSQEQMQQLVDADRRATSRNVALCGLLFGTAAGGIVMLLPGFVARHAARIVAGLLGGAVLGGAFGYSAGLGSVAFHEWFFERFIAAISNFEQREMFQLYRTILTHGLFFLLLGTGVGLGFAVAGSRRGTPRVLLSVGIIALIWGALFPFLASLVAPDQDTNTVLPNGSLSVFLWTSVFSVCVAVSVTMAAATAPPSSEIAPEL
jgi:hypothetical protein